MSQCALLDVLGSAVPTFSVRLLTLLATRPAASLAFPMHVANLLTRLFVQGVVNSNSATFSAINGATSNVLHQTRRVYKAQRIATYVGVRVDAAVQPDGVRLNISSRRPVIVPEVVVAQPRLLVEVLAREAQVDDEVFERVGNRLCRRGPEGLRNPAPAHVACRIHDHPRRIQVIGVCVIHPRLGRRRVREHGDQRTSEPNEFLQHATAAVVFPE